MLAYDSAMFSGDEVIPFEQVIAEKILESSAKSLFIPVESFTEPS